MTVLLAFQRCLLHFVLHLFSSFNCCSCLHHRLHIYSSRNHLKKIMSVVPKVWKRLIVTFLTIFVDLFVYFFVAAVVLFVWAVSVGQEHIMGFAVLAVLVILFMVWFFYMTTIWHLASIVTVLEEAYGFQAMVKSKLKGKLWLSISVFTEIAFKRLVCLQIIPP